MVHPARRSEWCCACYSWPVCWSRRSLTITRMTTTMTTMAAALTRTESRSSTSGRVSGSLHSPNASSRLAKLYLRSQLLSLPAHRHHHHHHHHSVAVVIPPIIFMLNYYFLTNFLHTDRLITRKNFSEHLIYTALHWMQSSHSQKKTVRPSVKRVDCDKNGRKICLDFLYMIRKTI